MLHFYLQSSVRSIYVLSGTINYDISEVKFGLVKDGRYRSVFHSLLLGVQFYKLQLSRREPGGFEFRIINVLILMQTKF